MSRPGDGLWPGGKPHGRPFYLPTPCTSVCGSLSVLTGGPGSQDNREPFQAV